MKGVFAEWDETGGEGDEEWRDFARPTGFVIAGTRTRRLSSRIRIIGGRQNWRDERDRRAMTTRKDGEVAPGMGGEGAVGAGARGVGGGLPPRCCVPALSVKPIRSASRLRYHPSDGKAQGLTSRI